MTSVRRILIAGILIGLIGSLFITVQDFNAQNSYKNSLYVLDYNSVDKWSKTTGEELTKLLNTAKQNKINTIAIQEIDLRLEDGVLEGFFNQEQDIGAFMGIDIIKQNNLNLNNNSFFSYLSSYEVIADNIYLLITSKKRGNEIFEAASKKYGNRVKKIDVNNEKTIIEIENSEALPIIGLGFDPSTISTIKNQGFNIVARPVNAAYSEEQKSDVKNYLSYIKDELQAKAVIFAGTEGIFGMPVAGGMGFLTTTAEYLQSLDRKNNPIFGFVEMAKFEGNQKLANYLDYNLARVHSISENEWKIRYDAKANEATIASAVERFRLSYNDRSVHVFYIRPFMKSIEFNEQYFSKLATISKGTHDDVSAVPGRNSLPSWALLVLGIGMGSAVLLLFLQVFKNSQKIVLALLAIGSLGVAGIALVAQSYHVLLQKLIALGSAITFPVLAIVIAFMWFDNSGSTKDMVRRIALAVGVTLVGGLYVHSSLATLRFMTSIEVFPMVKVALLLPIPLTFLIIILNDDVKNNIVNLLNMNIKMYHAVIAGVAVIALGLLVIRSGNNPVIAVSSMELKIRAILQKTLIARPRFKEFVLGIPMIVLSAYLFIKNKSTLITLTIGSIGLSSMVNTFAHLHKPLWMAFLTSFNGIWIGVLVGLLLVLIYKLVDKTGIFEMLK